MRLSPEILKKAVTLIIRCLNGSEEEASLVAENLVVADMRGIDTHGVYMLRNIFERVKAGLMFIPTRIKIIEDKGATALIDGGNGIGQVAAKHAVDLSIQKAKDYGIGLVLVRNTNHIGILSFYSNMVAKEGMIGIVACNSAPSMAPWGGVTPFFGTNPLSIAVPSPSTPVILDMSMSVVARGKIRRAQRLKEKIPTGWALDENGNPTTDPDKAMKGVLLPIGGPKGYGLAMMIDILSGVLSGSNYGPNVKTFHRLEGPTGIGVAVMAIAINRFMPLDQFLDLMKGYMDSVRQCKKAEGTARIYLPGEIEAEKELESVRNGVEIHESTITTINQILEELGIDYKIGGVR
jgi:LDH2 family malate/lactate/ureidoglycolate dehydrogenase